MAKSTPPRKLSDEKRAQEVKQRRVGIGGISLETLGLEDQEAMSKRSAFCLARQARFANAGFATDEDSAPLGLFGTIDEQSQRCKLARPANEYGACDRSV